MITVANFENRAVTVFCLACFLGFEDKKAKPAAEIASRGKPIKSEDLGWLKECDERVRVEMVRNVKTRDNMSEKMNFWLNFFLNKNENFFKFCEF